MQNIFCSKCGSSNDVENAKCYYCGAILLKPNDDIQVIKQELQLLKEEYEVKFKTLQHKIDKFEWGKKETQEEKVEVPKNPLLPPVAEVEIKEKTLAETLIPIQKEEKLVEEPIANEIQEAEPVVLPNAEVSKEKFPKKVSIPKKPNKSIKERLKSVPFLALLLEGIGSPLASFWEFVENIYAKYKEKNQLPVFFMTLAGIGALLFGFGYLMQLSVGYIGKLSEMVKIGFGFLCSSGIIIWATRLYKKASKYDDFSSALIGLAVSMNYLFVYFLSNISHEEAVIASPILGFAIIILNTLLAIFFALRFETRIVAVLSLLGGAFAPFYLNTEGSSLAYFGYLWLLCVASIYVAYKIKWKTLGIVAFITSAAIIEMAFLSDIKTFSLLGYSIIFHAFSYLFLWFCLFEGKNISEVLTKNTVILIAGNLSVFLFNLYYLFSDSGHYTILGFIYLINALIFFPGLWMYKQQASKKMRLLILVIAGTFIAFAIPAIFDRHLLGFFWSVEALALIFLGYIFAISSVRKEGYILLLIAIGRVMLTLNNLWFLNGDHVLLTSGYFNLFTVGPVFSAVLFLMLKYKKINLKYENKLIVIVSNILAIWFATTYTISASFYTFTWLSFVVVIAALIILMVGYSQKLNFIRKFGYAVFIGCVVYSAIYAIIDIAFSWDNFVLTKGFVNMMGIGAFLYSLNRMFYLLQNKKPDLFKGGVKTYLVKVNEFIATWFIPASIVISTYFVSAFIAFVMVPVSFLYLFWGKIQSNKIKKMGYAVYVVSILYSIIYAYVDIGANWNAELLCKGFFNLIGIGLFLFAMVVFQRKLFDTKEKTSVQFTGVLLELISVWFTFFFLITGLQTIGEYTYIVAVIPMFALTYWGHFKKLPLTEYLGLAYGIIIITGILFSVSESGSYRFSMQTLYGKIAMLEILACLWSLKLFYDKLLKGSKNGQAMDVVREIFYWIVPFLIVLWGNRHYNQYLPVALGMAALVNFLFYEITHRKSLIIEFTILTGLAAVLSLKSDHYLFSIFSLVLVLAYAFIKQKAYLRRSCFKSPFLHIFIPALYYIGISLFVIMLNILNNTSDAVFIAVVYFAAIVILRKNIAPLRSNYHIAFWISILGFVSGLAIGYVMEIMTNPIFVIISLFSIGVLLYGKNTVYKLRNKPMWVRLIMLFHILVFTSYFVYLEETGLTIALILHAILVLFNSMKKYCKKLVWQSISIFAIAIIKLFFWDIAYFNMLQKVIVFIVIGGLLIGASFLFVKLKERFGEPDPA